MFQFLPTFGRSLRHLVNALADLESLGVSFISLRDNLDLSTPSGKVCASQKNPWVRSRQEQLEADLARTLAHDPLLVQKIPGTKRVQIAKERVN